MSFAQIVFVLVLTMSTVILSLLNLVFCLVFFFTLNVIYSAILVIIYCNEIWIIFFLPRQQNFIVISPWTMGTSYPLTLTDPANVWNIFRWIYGRPEFLDLYQYSIFFTKTHCFKPIRLIVDELCLHKIRPRGGYVRPLFTDHSGTYLTRVTFAKTFFLGSWDRLYPIFLGKKLTNK